MQVGIRRGASSLLCVGGCSLSLLAFVSPAPADPPDGRAKPGGQDTAAGAEPADRLAEPFLLLLPADWQQAVGDPEAYARWALTEEAGESRLEPYTTPSGIHVLRPVEKPLVQPDPGLSGLIQRELSEPLLIFLRALSDEQRGLLCRGEVVNVTSASDTVARLVRHGRFGPQSRHGLNEELVAGSPLLAVLEVVPTLRFTTLRRTMGGVCEVELHHRWVCGDVRDVQLRPGGATFWSSFTAPGAKRDQAPREWRDAQPRRLSGLSRDRTEAVLPDLLSALDTPGASVSMLDVGGSTLDRLFEDVRKLTGIDLSIGGIWSSCIVYAKGGEVSARALVEALFAAGELGIWRLGDNDDDSLTVLYNPSGGRAASHELDGIARERAAPEVTEELRSLLDGALEEPHLADLPVPLSLFTSGYDGPVSDLPEQQAKWVSEVVRACVRFWQSTNVRVRDYGWLAGVEPIIVRATVVYQMMVSACVPFRSFDSAKREYVAADPPETFYTLLGASRDSPIFSTVNAVLRGY